MKNQAKNAIKLALAALLLLWLVRRGGIDFVLLGKIFDPLVVTVCLGLMLATFIANNVRWALLLRSQGVPALASRLLPLTFIGQFFNIALPGGVGGDVIKGYYLTQQMPEDRLKAALSVIVDRILGLLGLIIIATAAVAFNFDLIVHKPQLTTFAVLIVGLLIGFIVFFCLAFSSTLFNSNFLRSGLVKLPGGAGILRVYSTIHAYRSQPGVLANAVLISVASQLFTVGSFYMSSVAMNLQIPFSAFIFCVPLNMIATAFPLTPAGIGVGQTVLYFLFNWFLGAESPAGPNIASAMQLLSLPWILVGAVFYLKFKPSNGSADGQRAQRSI